MSEERAVPSFSGPILEAHDFSLQAACLDEDPDLFFPRGTRIAAMRQLEEARRVCRRCPVTAECLALALRTNERHGMWGATTPDERLSLLKPRRRRHYGRCNDADDWEPFESDEDDYLAASCC
ncbi:WhiB family transcriptional regulator [Nocardioides sp. LS1]|uniref:WhiB family transcriptional regulator n=1 Tax=Nocardioides sp. LS1 TaxID=1027620 RepID=UPI000FFABAF6|nr:WhiB family transcriptional regulator [Nocardioides sp. LS1]GCD88075.1 hypothetical protein NLS1_00810 [Nocardioides sp. LS1]